MKKNTHKCTFAEDFSLLFSFVIVKLWKIIKIYILLIWFFYYLIKWTVNLTKKHEGSAKV